MSMAILLAIFLVLVQVAKIFNKHNLVDKTFSLFEDPNSTCNRCGRDVSVGSGFYNNRIKDNDSIEIRKSKGEKIFEVKIYNRTTN
ncbi:MAG: hypothetical protein IPM32_14000 [Ignavibacteriae bacterium]|nr:hypothetical protein [Ignavibacteriota bacterium]